MVKMDGKNMTILNNNLKGITSRGILSDACFIKFKSIYVKTKRESLSLSSP